MYCSVKFLSPSVTGGLPFPGCADAFVPPDVELSFLSLLPQAATAAASTSASIALVSERTPIRLMVLPPSPAASGRLDYRSHFWRAAPQPGGRHEALDQREQPLDEKGQPGHPHGRREHAG